MASREPQRPVAFGKWISENRDKLKPPVANKLLFEKQIKTMVVGGPNQRADFHLEEGEEIFFQLQGAMVLKVVEKGQPRDIHIGQGEIFLLPGRVPHSPQRFENTIGLVLERERYEDEMDSLSWYNSKGNEIIYQEFFHCYDLGVQLVPVIERFNKSEEKKTDKAKPKDTHTPDPVTPDPTITLSKPFSLDKWLADNKHELQEKGFKVLFGEGEFRVVAHFGRAGDEIASRVIPGRETVMYWYKGNGELTVHEGSSHNTFHTNEGDMFLLMPDASLKSAKPSEGAILIEFTCTPLRDQKSIKH
eukprot:TRINITY_DN2045_c0_g1_i1.p1 TRINITY_DN2045_c0_g1~~TRINITY_DN2045_c0_g1_i1.p1  ORF type:complete len:303 (-),score=81.39 TRINITY_DN2045_c0_g1_i1:440-1348(-)